MSLGSRVSNGPRFICGDRLNAALPRACSSFAAQVDPRMRIGLLNDKSGIRRVARGLRMYQRPLGVRGVLAFCAHRVFGRPITLTVRVPQFITPVALRLRTSDVSIFEDIIIRGQYALSLPFEPETIVDAGANIGLASVYYANRYPNARIVAVEPEPSNFDVLLRNVSSYSNIFPVRAALWHRNGHVALNGEQGPDAAKSKVGFTVGNGDGLPVRAITIPTLMQEAHISSIHLLKVDIEGAEREVFANASGWMGAVSCLAIELHDRFKEGCRAAVSSATKGFIESQVGEITLYVRESCAPNKARQSQTTRSD